MIAGIVVTSLGSETELEGGAGIAGAGLAIFAMNWLIRKATDDPARAEEEAAREFFDRHGRWPDEVADHSEAASATAPVRPSAPSSGAVGARHRREPAIPRTRGHRRRRSACE